MGIDAPVRADVRATWGLAVGELVIGPVRAHLRTRIMGSDQTMLRKVAVSARSRGVLDVLKVVPADSASFRRVGYSLRQGPRKVQASLVTYRACADEGTG